MESTIVSFLPYDLHVPLPGLIPASFFIPKVEDDQPFGDFNAVYIPDCIAYVYSGDGRSVRTVCRSEEIAGSICLDHISASYATQDDAFPGLKAIPGKHEKDDIKKNFPEIIEGVFHAHRRWYQNLVNLADDIWKDPMARGKSKTISDVQRTASRKLGLNKEWQNTARIDQIPCPACTKFISEQALICPECKTIVKPKEYNAMFQRAPENSIGAQAIIGK